MTKQWKPLSVGQLDAISPFYDLIVSGLMIYDRLLTVCCGCYAQRANGAICLPSGLIGKPSITMAPATRFRRWKQDGTFGQINLALNHLDRKRVGKEAYTSVVCINSQSVKLAPMIWENRGLDVNKRVNGRKRQLIFDTQGRLWLAVVHSANQADGPSPVSLVSDLLWQIVKRLEKVYGDQSYDGVFA